MAPRLNQHNSNFSNYMHTLEKLHVHVLVDHYSKKDKRSTDPNMLSYSSWLKGGGHCGCIQNVNLRSKFHGLTEHSDINIIKIM